MKTLGNEIVLRPRFRLLLKKPKEQYLEAFEKSDKKPFLVKRIDDHVFIKFNKVETHFWSPQLHLEIVEKDENEADLYGLFGPNPTLWTFFMFLHFGVGTLFIILAVWTYVNWSLGYDYRIQVGLMTLLILIWFALYAFGRAGKRKGRPQMNQLYHFMQEILQ
ncbi:GTP-binding protein [Spongiimicrobium sp. 3-5]|uniref:GTP-binding protein n=1 Tax=Spongiimicrobium sp. 3-5 TaxID=3332596 RepID=UPI00397F2E97